MSLIRNIYRFDNRRNYYRYATSIRLSESNSKLMKTSNVLMRNGCSSRVGWFFDLLITALKHIHIHLCEFKDKWNGRTQLGSLCVVQAVFSWKIVYLPNLHMNRYVVPSSISISFLCRFIDTVVINDSPIRKWFINIRKGFFLNWNG